MENGSSRDPSEVSEVIWGECMTTTRYDCMFQELLQIVLVRENWGREANACIHSK